MYVCMQCSLFIAQVRCSLLAVVFEVSVLFPHSLSCISFLLLYFKVQKSMASIKQVLAERVSARLNVARRNHTNSEIQSEVKPCDTLKFIMKLTEY